MRGKELPLHIQSLHAKLVVLSKDFGHDAYFAFILSSGYLHAISNCNVPIPYSVFDRCLCVWAGYEGICTLQLPRLAVRQFWLHVFWNILWLLWYLWKPQFHLFYELPGFGTHLNAQVSRTTSSNLSSTWTSRDELTRMITYK